MLLIHKIETAPRASSPGKQGSCQQRGGSLRPAAPHLPPSSREEGGLGETTGPCAGEFIIHPRLGVEVGWGFFLLQPAVWPRGSSSQRAPGCRHLGTTDPSPPGMLLCHRPGNLVPPGLPVDVWSRLHRPQRGIPPKHLQCLLSAAEKKGGDIGSDAASSWERRTNFKRP